ncbi:proteinase-activated receptor 4-like [Polyodon spathula]|nr:proteinase-activated receptor 4-like [Polyodon spathula]
MDCRQSERISVIIAVLLSWMGLSSENPDCKSRVFLIQESCKNGVRVFDLEESGIPPLTSRVTTLVIPILYTAVFVIGLPANMKALWVLLTKMKRAPSTILLTNLALADLLLIILLPFKITYYFQGNHWIFGEPLCRTLTAGFYGNMYGSILCLMFISIDRYIALVHPFSAKSFRSTKLAVSACVVVWVSVVGSMSPFVFTQQSYSLENTNFTICHDALPRELQTNLFFYCFLLLFGFGFLIPFSAMFFCYISILWALRRSPEKYIRTIKIMALSLVVFIVCFFPSNVILLLHYSESHPEKASAFYFPYLISLALSTFNCCIDPFIYYYVSDDFRAKVREAAGWVSQRSGTQSSQRTGDVCLSNRSKSGEAI